MLPDIRSELMAANDAGQMVMPVLLKDGSTAFYLFDVLMKNEINFGPSVDLVQTERIVTPKTGNAETINVIGDNFLISFSTLGEPFGFTYLVQSDGTAQQIADRMIERSIFPYAGDWYGWMTTGELFRSTDEGFSWNKISDNYADNGLSDLGQLRSYSIVDGKTVLYTHEAIYLVESLSGDQFTVQPLDLTGFEGGDVTAIQEWNGNVFATTLSGVWYRNVEDFLLIAEP